MHLFGSTHRLLLSPKGGVGLAVTPQPYATPVQFVIIGVCLGCYNELKSSFIFQALEQFVDNKKRFVPFMGEICLFNFMDNYWPIQVLYIFLIQFCLYFLEMSISSRIEIFFAMKLHIVFSQN